jgi:hypothetical protein
VNEGGGFVPVAQSIASGRTFTDLIGPGGRGRGSRPAHPARRHDAGREPDQAHVTIDPVPDDFGVEILPLAGTTGVGYLHLRTYISTADAQLRDAFAQFRAQNLQYYIVDLRYNGGGLVASPRSSTTARRRSHDRRHAISAWSTTREVRPGFNQPVPAARSVGESVRIAFPHDTPPRPPARSMSTR